MKEFVLKYQYPILIIIIGLFWLQALNLLLQLDIQHLIYPDSQDYHLSAEKMFRKFTGHYYRPMGMAFITGFPYLLGSSDAGIYQWSLFVNLGCWLGTSLVLFQIAKNFLSEKGAFWITIIPFFIVGGAVLNYHLLTETIYTFCIVCAFYFLLRYDQTKAFRFLSIALSILLLTMLIKPGSKFLAIAFGLYFIKDILKNCRQKSAVLLYGSLLLIAIQVVGMRVQYGDFTLSYIDGVTYYNYLFSKSDCYKNGTEYHQLNNPRADFIFAQKTLSDQKKVAVADMKEQMLHNTGNVFKAYVSDVIDNTKSGNICIADLKNELKKPDFESNKQFFFSVSKWQNRFFTFAGILLALAFCYKGLKEERIYALMGFYVLYIIILSGISSSQGDRFHLVTFPIVLVLLAKFLSEKTTFFRKHIEY